MSIDFLTELDTAVALAKKENRKLGRGWLRNDRPQSSVAQVFPEALETAEQRILYILWNEGDQPLFNLILLCGLSQREVCDSVSALESRGKVSTSRLQTRPHGQDTPDDTIMVSLNR